MKAVGPGGIAEIAIARGNVAAQARCVIGHARPDAKVQFFEGVVTGTVVAPRGAGSFGWDPIFVPDGFNKTFAEMTPDEKNRISHRRRAFEELRRSLIELSRGPQ